jgi:hypothetical protein
LYLPTLKDSPEAVPTTKKGKIPFGNADLAAIVLMSVPMMWQNQYNLTHLTVPESMCVLLPDLRVMVEKQNEKLKKQRVRLIQPILTPRVIPREKPLGAQENKSLRKPTVRSFATVVKLTVTPTRPTIPWTATAMTAIVSPSW